MRFHRIARGLLVVVSLALAACSGGENADAEAVPAPEPMSQAGADAMRNAFVRAYMTKDAPGATAFYASDAVMYGPDGSMVTGKPAIEAAFSEMMAAGMDSLGLVSTSFEATGDTAVDQGTFVMRTLDPQTKEASYMNGGYMITIARQTDGTFQIVKDSTWAAPSE